MSLKKVISASRRTDIPAFYLDWFIEAINQGSVEVENPFYKNQIRSINLHPDEVEWIVFWSRNYNRFLKHHHHFKLYNLLFHFTILPSCLFDSKTPDIKDTLLQVKELVSLYGPDRIIWRYDPVLFWKTEGVIHSNIEIEQFQYLCNAMTRMGIYMCYTSIATPYSKFLNRQQIKFPDKHIFLPGTGQLEEVFGEMSTVAHDHDIQLFACCSESLNNIEGIKEARCIDGSYLNMLSGQKKVSEARYPSRPLCGCTASIDIGNYLKHPCYFGCLYCYANPVWK